MSPANVPYFPPAKARAHEVCGPGAHMFALALAARLGGQVIWVQETWAQPVISPTGFAEFTPPSELTLCLAKDQLEALAVAEESLRSGAASLVVMCLGKPLGLTEGRRLQLAAREGKSTALAIIPEGMGSNAAETRWQCTPVFDAGMAPRDSTLQKWDLIKNKSGTLGAWYVRWDTASRRIVMVSPPGK